MSGLSTKDVKTGGGGLPKTIEPGKRTLKINSIELKQFPFMVTDDGYYLVLHVETKPIEGFEGFFIDKEDESLGRYLGQIGQIKTNRYYYKDGTTKSGIVIERNMEILKVIKNLCIATGCEDWFDAANEKHATINDFVDAFNNTAPFKDKFLNFCVAGKEFERKNGYIGFDLFAPKLTRGTVAYEAEDTKVSRLIAFDADKHWEKFEKEEVEGFSEDEDADATDSALLPTGDETFTDAPDFEL